MLRKTAPITSIEQVENAPVVAAGSLACWKFCRADTEGVSGQIAMVC